MAFKTGSVMVACALVLSSTAFAQTSKWLQQAPSGDWRITPLLQANVHDGDGNEIGRIVDFLVDPDGAIKGAVIEIGRITGKDDSRIAVPFDQLQISVPGSADAEDLARDGTSPKLPSEPQLSGPQGSSVASAVKAAQSAPLGVTLRYPKADILKGPRFEDRP